jgi:hypothetical protein
MTLQVHYGRLSDLEEGLENPSTLFTRSHAVNGSALRVVGAPRLTLGPSQVVVELFGFYDTRFHNPPVVVGIGFRVLDVSTGRYLSRCRGMQRGA